MNATLIRETGPEWANLPARRRLRVMKTIKEFLDDDHTTIDLDNELHGHLQLYFARLCSWLKVIYITPSPTLTALLDHLQALLSNSAAQPLIHQFVDSACCQTLHQILVFDATDMPADDAPRIVTVNAARVAALRILRQIGIQNRGLRDYVCFDKSMDNIFAVLDTLDAPPHLDIFRDVLLDLSQNNPDHIDDIFDWLTQIIPTGPTPAKVVCAEVLGELMAAHPLLRASVDADNTFMTAAMTLDDNSPVDETGGDPWADRVCGVNSDPLPTPDTVRAVVCGLFSAELDVQLAIAPVMAVFCRYAPTVPFVAAVLVELLDSSSTKTVDDFYRKSATKIIPAAPFEPITQMTIKSNTARLLVHLLSHPITPVDESGSVDSKSISHCLLSAGIISILATHVSMTTRRDALALSMRSACSSLLRMLIESRPSVAYQLKMFFNKHKRDSTDLLAAIKAGIDVKEISDEFVELLALVGHEAFVVTDQIPKPVMIDRVSPTTDLSVEDQPESTHGDSDSDLSSDSGTHESNTEGTDDGEKMRYASYMKANPFRSFDQIMDRATDAADPLAMDDRINDTAVIEREAVEEEDDVGIDALLRGSAAVTLPGVSMRPNPSQKDRANLREFRYFSHVK